MGDTRALAHEVRWTLAQEGYEDLKARVRYELKKAEWKDLGRKAFLERCTKEKKEKKERPLEGVMTLILCEVIEVRPQQSLAGTSRCPVYLRPAVF